MDKTNGVFDPRRITLDLEDMMAKSLKYRLPMKKKKSLFSSPSFKEAYKRSQLIGKGLTSIKSASTARNMP